MTDVMEHSGIFCDVSRRSSSLCCSTDFRSGLPDNADSPLSEKTTSWRLNDDTVVELTQEHFYFPFATYEHYNRYTLRVAGRMIVINRVTKYYSPDGTIAPEKVVLHTAEGELEMHRVRILDDDGMRTDEFNDTALWCQRQLIAIS
jgi:hypothetical protein